MIFWIENMKSKISNDYISKFNYIAYRTSFGKTTIEYEHTTNMNTPVVPNLGNLGQSVQQAVPNLGKPLNIQNAISDFANAGPQASKPKSFVGRMLAPFSNAKYLDTSKDFLQSNSIVAKFAFLVLVIILFVLLMRLGISLLGYFFTPSKNPFLVKGMKDAKVALHIPQDPNVANSIPIYRSINQRDGLEFTWSVWLNISDLSNYKQGSYKHIFHKGNVNFNAEGLSEPNNAPGVYLDKVSNNLVIIMNTFNDIMEEVVISDIPLNKWVLVHIRVEGEIMDVFVNGTVAKRHRFQGVPKQNYGDVYVNYNGGFSGYLSNLRYHDYALSLGEIMSMNKSGPNMTMNQMSGDVPPYFSMRWYMQNAGSIGAI